MSDVGPHLFSSLSGAPELLEPCAGWLPPPSRRGASTGAAWPLWGHPAVARAASGGHGDGGQLGSCGPEVAALAGRGTHLLTVLCGNRRIAGGECESRPGGGWNFSSNFGSTN